jgi:hypothetical protein
MQTLNYSHHESRVRKPERRHISLIVEPQGHKPCKYQADYVPTGAKTAMDIDRFMHCTLQDLLAMSKWTSQKETGEIEILVFLDYVSIIIVHVKLIIVKFIK